MADERITTTDTSPHTSVVEKRGGGVRTIILVAAVVVLIAVAFAVFGRRSGEGKKDTAIGTAAVTAVPDRSLG